MHMYCLNLMYASHPLTWVENLFCCIKVFESFRFQVTYNTLCLSCVGFGLHSSFYIYIEYNNRRRMADGQDPKIDELNEELLVIILSYLSVKEAAKTCLVSRRWRYLWQYTTGCFEIYDRDKKSYSRKSPCSFMKLVNQALVLHQGPTLDQFRVGFCYSGSWYMFDHWVKFAIQKEVKLFELDLAADSWQNCGGWSQYDFPDIERLSSGDNDKLKFSRFCSNLKSLTLVNVSVMSSACLCFRRLENLKVTGPLKSMEISRCPLIKGLEVDASNLESFTYIGPHIEIPFRNVDQLSELTIGQGYCFSFICKPDKHASYSSKLRKLKLMVRYEVDCPYNFPVLDNLRELELDIQLYAGRSLHYFTLFTKACPLLSSFIARITYTNILYDEIFASPRQFEHNRGVHKHLKLVKLIGFTGCVSDYELVLHFLEIGGSLEEIILKRTFDHFHQKINGMAFIGEQIKQLQANCPAGVKMVLTFVKLRYGKWV
uniref:F-box domain-containing protein n=1 Tax=Solanum lycopersicum TaxID=4081 RepID=A0A3Q7GAE9_SOLLC